MKIFLSAVSKQFKECRDALASDLRAVGAEVVVQEDFQQHGRSLLEKLEQYISGCDRVIALVGDAYGWEPDEAARPPDRPRRSYTQFEYFFAKGERLDGSSQSARDIYVYFASPEFLDQYPVVQEPDAARRQQQFVAEIRSSGKDWNRFRTLDELGRLVLRDGFRLRERRAQPRNLPFDSLGTLFKGREQFLKDLHQRLHPTSGNAAAIVAKQCIHGLGGVGKTRLAIEYALAFQAEYSALLFVTADTPESLRRNLAALCSPKVLNLAEQGAKEEQVRVDAVHRWLAEHSDWLLILDNVDTKEAATEIESLLDQVHGGHVLITSRWSVWSGSVEAVELDVLGPDDAVAFLLERTAKQRRLTPTDAADAHALADELGSLAVALEQAGAFVSKTHVSLNEYLRRWREREEKVRQWHDASLMKYPRSVAVTWNTTFEQLEVGAQSLLRMLCWFAPEPIPRSVFETEQAKKALAEGVEMLRLSSEPGVPSFPLPPAANDSPARAARAPDIEDSLAGLAGFSLIRWESANDAFRIHRLVEEITRYRLPIDQREPWLRAALGILNDYLPGKPPPQDVRSWPWWEPIRPHVAVVIAAADAADVFDPTTRLMNALAVLLTTKCIWGEAESLYRRALAIDEKSYGLDHPEVATALNNLAQLLKDTNRLAEAEPLMARTVTIFEKSLGANHPGVATALNNLALLLKDTNRLAEAEPLMRRALAIDEKSYGSDHPNVARDLNNLAQLLKDTNRLAEAEPLMRRALAIDEKSYGSDHPNVARDLSNLAQLLRATNRLAEAEPLMRRALAIDEKSYGSDHPNVASDLSNLAQSLQDTNRLAEAEPLMARTVTIFEKALGANHPNVATALSNLAQLLRATNRLAEAEPLMRRALAIHEKSYGSDHPNVASDLSNLAQSLQDTNRLAEAEPLMRRALAIFEKSLGENHPNVATALNNLAQLLQDTNRLAEAEPLMARTVTIFEKSLGENHPNVATALNNLAQLLKDTNRLAEAEPLMARTATIFEKSLGANHPNVATALNNVALLLRATNRLAEAEPLMRRALAIDEKSYGSDHPKVATDLNNLAQLLQDTNRLAEAEPLMRRALAIFLHFNKTTGHEHPNERTVAANYRSLLEQMDRTSNETL